MQMHGPLKMRATLLKPTATVRSRTANSHNININPTSAPPRQSFACASTTSSRSSLLRSSRVALPLRSARAVVSASASSLSTTGEDDVTLEQMLRSPRVAYHAPAPLPPTPSAATLGALMPYLAKLALGEGQLYWRVGGALIALIM